MSKRKSESFLESERPRKAQKIVSAQLRPVTNTTTKSVESDTVHGPTLSTRGLTRAQEQLISDAPLQEAFLRDLDDVLRNADLSAWSPEDAQKVALPNTADGLIPCATASRNIDLALAHPPTDDQMKSNDSPASEPVDQISFERLFCSETTSQPSTNYHAESDRIPQTSKGQADIHLPLNKPSPISQEMPSLPNTPPHPIASQEIIRDYKNGRLFPSSYLTEIRRQVDADFSNDNWGDSHYLSDAYPFRYFEDFRSDPHKKRDDRAIHQGLKLQAARIPEQTIEESWKRFEDSFTHPELNDSLEAAGTETETGTVTLEQMQQRIQTHIESNRPTSLHRDLEPIVQQQKIFHSLQAMRGLDPPITLITSETHPFRIAMPRTSPWREESARAWRERRASLSARLQQRLEKVGGMAMGMGMGTGIGMGNGGGELCPSTPPELG